MKRQTNPEALYSRPSEPAQQRKDFNAGGELVFGQGCARWAERHECSYVPP